MPKQGYAGPLERIDECRWRIPVEYKSGMRVEGQIFADERLIDQIRADGGSPFWEYQLPEAVLKFKQGFGRLIRNKNDTGTVIVLDNRVVSKPYGKAFLQALPPVQMQIDHDAP